MGELRFSGHESFQCRNLWPKKGYDFKINSERDFRDDLSVIDLGVGKNMVTSIRFWMNAFDLFDEEEKPTKIADYLFGPNGQDQFLEDLGTLWLLHYHLIKRDEASIYSLVFNEFRKQRIEFTKKHLKSFLLSKCDEKGETHSPNSIDTDISVLLKSYVKPDSVEGRKSIEDQYSSLLIELDLIKKFTNTGLDDNKWYSIQSDNRENLSKEIFFYTILDNYTDNRSISLHKLLNDENSPGLVFALNPDALIDKLKLISKQYEGVVYTEDAGVRELQINKYFNSLDILDKYYGQNK